MNFRLPLLLALLLPWLLPALHSQTSGSVRFRHLSTGQGLSQSQVNFLLKDSRGFLWAATQDGLNRYDAYQFRHFYHQDGDPASLSSNYVWCLEEDGNGHIWVGTFGGEICRYDQQTETFQSFPIEPFTRPNIAGNSVRSLCEHPAGTLWIGADRGVYTLKISTLELKKRDFYFTKNKQGEGPADDLLNVVALCPLPGGRVLAGGALGLFVLDTSGHPTRPVLFLGENFPSVSAIVPTAEPHGFWVGTSKGLYQLRHFPKGDSITAERDVVFEKNAPSPFIQSLFLDEKNTLWVGTNQGLGRLAGGRYEHFLKNANDPNSLSGNEVYAILEVEPGLMMAGTREGLNVFSNEKPPFQNLNAANTPGLLCSEALLGPLLDREDNLWVASRQGLTRIGRFSEGENYWQAECLTPANTPSMPGEYVIQIRQDRRGDLWACFRRNGFAKLKKNTAGRWSFEKTDRFDGLLAGAGMNDIYVDNQGITWLATPGLGLVKWQQETGEAEVFTTDSTAGSLKHPYIFRLLEDSRGRFWVCTANGGLCEMDRRTGRFTCHVHDDRDGASISSNMILSVFEDSRQRLWACTANGLNLLEDKGRFRRFYQKDGLPNEVVYGLLEAADGHLWASTNRGISRIFFDGKNFNTQNFTSADGLAHDEFNQHAFLQLPDGRLAFGSSAGLTLFDPADIRSYPHPPKVALTDFQLFNRSVPIGGEGDFVLKKAINELSEITLRHDQNFIAFEFAALGYTQPQGNRYAYQLVGLDGDWVQSEGRRFANYPNLAPGNYEFRMRAANHDDVWSEDFKSLKIRILPPWWATWWAYLLYGLAVIGASWGIIRFRENSIRRLEQAKAEERERFRKRTARDFHDEAGNRITKLALLTEVAKRKTDEHLLAQMEENIQALRSGMRDFIWVLDPDCDNLLDTLRRLKDFGNGLFEHSTIQFRTEGLDERLRQSPLNGNERRHILLIFKEAMNNCVKYSAATEAVLSVEGRAIVFSDNGKGFDPATATGNGLRNMRERAGKLGMGLEIKSQANAGSSVKLTLVTKEK